MPGSAQARPCYRSRRTGRKGQVMQIARSGCPAIRCGPVVGPAPSDETNPLRRGCKLVRRLRGGPAYNRPRRRQSATTPDRADRPRPPPSRAADPPSHRGRGEAGRPHPRAGARLRPSGERARPRPRASRGDRGEPAARGPRARRPASEGGRPDPPQLSGGLAGRPSTRPRRARPRPARRRGRAGASGSGPCGPRAGRSWPRRRRPRR